MIHKILELEGILEIISAERQTNGPKIKLTEASRTLLGLVYFPCSFSRLGLMLHSGQHSTDLNENENTNS